MALQVLIQLVLGNVGKHFVVALVCCAVGNPERHNDTAGGALSSGERLQTLLRTPNPPGAQAGSTGMSQVWHRSLPGMPEV